MNSNSSSLIAQLDNPFWRFSLSVYQNEDVKLTCLHIQDTYHANINALLFCCWLAYAVEEVLESDLLHACHTVLEWNKEVTQSLRKTRRWVKSIAQKNPWVDDFAQQLLIDEIVSETYQQYQLFSYFEKRQKKCTLINHELAITYLGWLFADLKVSLDEELKTHMQHLVSTIFSMVTKINYEENAAHHRH